MKKIFLVVFLVTFLFLTFGLVYGACTPCPSEQRGGVVPCGRNCDDPRTPNNECEPCQLCHFFVMFENIFHFVLFDIVPPLAVLMLAIGGFMYLFAYLSPGEVLPGGGKGGPKLLAQAKGLISSVIFGLIIIFAAWLIVNTFFMVIGVASWTGLSAGWWRIECPILR
jgi:hypothetical protein